MLHTFISSRSARPGNVAGALLSTFAHAGLIAFAVVATRVPVHYRHDRDRQPTEHLRFVTAARVIHAASHLAAAGARVVAAQSVSLETVLRNLSSVHLAFDVNLPVAVAEPRIDYGEMAAHGLTFIDSADGDVLHKVAIPGKVYTENAVEESVLPRNGNPKPVYPLFLQQIGVGTAFTVRFVVDTTGHIEDHTLEFPPETHRLFIDAVRRALLRSRYWPAEIAGQRVRQMVEQTFIFRMAP